MCLISLATFCKSVTSTNWYNVHKCLFWQNASPVQLRHKIFLVILEGSSPVRKFFKFPRMQCVRLVFKEWFSKTSFSCTIAEMLFHWCLSGPWKIIIILVKIYQMALFLKKSRGQTLTSGIFTCISLTAGNYFLVLFN